MVMFLWFAAMVATTSASQEFLQFRRQVTVDDITREPKKVGCNLKFDQKQHEVLNETHCALREVYLGLLPPAATHSVNPETLWVKRCVGTCISPDSGYTCRPGKIVRRNLPITLYDVNFKKYYCSTFTLEEDDQCYCDYPESTCSTDEVILDLDPIPGDPEVSTAIDPRVLIKRCSGDCSDDGNCVPDRITNKELRTISGVYTAEEHETCRCDTSPVESSANTLCAPYETFITLPADSSTPNQARDTFLTKRCSGGCASENFKCKALKIVVKTVPNTQQKVEEEVTCACVKQPDA